MRIGELWIYIKSKRKEFLLSFISVFVGIIIALSISEYSFKKNYYHGVNTQFDKELGWAPIPNFSTLEKGKLFTTNSLGFRSEEIDPHKKSILILGDSVAWGYGVNDNETVSNYLSEDLSRYQVLNLAVSGYDIGQSYLRLKKHIEKLNPEIIVVVVFSGNDLNEILGRVNYGKNKPFFAPINGRLVLTNSQISKDSCVNTLMKWGMLAQLPFISSKEISCEDRVLNLEEGVKVIQALLSKIEQLAKKRNSELIYVLSPQFYDLVLDQCEKYPAMEKCKQYHERFLDLIVHGPDLPPEEIIKDYRLRGNLAVFHKIFNDSSYDYIDYYQEILVSPAGNKQLSDTILEHLSKKMDLIS
jgi:lysophospholipase L1-like esterase